jgi:hypothetical protein
MAAEVFIIDDLDKFIECTRVLIYQNFGSDTRKDILETSFDINKLDAVELQELDSVLSQTECLLMAKDYIRSQQHKTNKTIRYLISNNEYMKMIECFNSRMVSNMLNNLVNKGVLETAYDAESNDFIFWTKNDDTKSTNQKPETD